MPTLCEQYKDALYAQLARLTKAMAHPARLQLLDLLLQAPRTVETLSQEIGMSIASTSQHLQVLRTAQLVESRKHGLYVTYRLADETVYDLMQNLRLIAQRRLAEVETLTRSLQAGQPEAVQRQQLMECLERGEVVVVDVRPIEEYRAGHLPGALSIPLPELENRLNELPRDRQIITYCRGIFCVMATAAVKVLQAHGFLATYLKDSVRELEAAGLGIVRENDR